MNDKAIIKFNGRNLALLCSKCRNIIKTGKDFTEEELDYAFSICVNMDEKYCEKCLNSLTYTKDIDNGKPI
jgi:hypothetical protein